jgi:predicted nucleic acid-binding protein
MTYVDSSVMLAHLLVEPRRPAPAFWRRDLVSSVLLAYEVWNRIHARGLTGTHGEAAREALARVAMVPFDDHVLRRALDPFPLPVRTLDALHLSTLVHILGTRGPVELATYDCRMADAAAALGLPLASLA